MFQVKEVKLMKSFVKNFICGADPKTSGAIAFAVIAFIGLGCFCKKDGVDLLKPNASNVSYTSNSTTTETPVSTSNRTTSKKADASKGEIPSQDELQEMVKTTLLDFNDAVEDEDFTTFYENISRLWQKQTTAGKLKETFNLFIQKKIDISSISSRQAEFSSNPRIDDSKGFKELIVDGKYNTSPLPTKFTLKYTPEGKDWKLTGIVVDTTP